MNDLCEIEKAKDPTYELFMNRCIELAMLGSSNVSPNPMVGCVIVYKDKIIGEGYHRVFGEAHAEVNAIQSVKDKSLLSESTLYVNLEPCNHYGKTPPCTELILQHKIPEVVIGNTDQNEKTAGKGIKRLRENGCKVTTGILEKACRELNIAFFTFHEKKRPYIILKWAESLDGFLDKQRSPDDPAQPNWITNEHCRMLVHKWRSEVQTIIVGTNTIKMDNPSLTVRDWSGNNPMRVLIDRKGKLKHTYNVFNEEAPCRVFSYKKRNDRDNIRYFELSKKEEVWPQVLSVLHQNNIISLFVEGGSLLMESMINQELWDEARIFKGAVLFKRGILAPKLSNAIFVANHEIFGTPLFIFHHKMRG